ACIKLRRYNLAAQKAVFFLKKQDFRYSGMEIKFSCPTSIPSDIINIAKDNFDRIYKEKTLYRASGIVLFNLEEDKIRQLDLFGSAIRAEELKKLYESVDKVNCKFGKHTVFLGSSFWANKFGAHLTERGNEPERKNLLAKGETKRKRLNIPMFVYKL
ncbi:MAG TPA: DNA polymerase IV, partial [Patescibacteria group bacterium]|nr:DNA polymerase IV [Patescibacteria group bacterium]